MAEVVVPLDDARDGRLPPICAMTGDRADGAIPIRLGRSLFRWGAPTIRVPLSTSAFRKWSIAQSVMVRVRIVAFVLVVVALGFSAKSPFIALVALVTGGVAMAISVRAERRVERLQPAAERVGSSVRLRGVHDDFAAAVDGSR